MEKMSEAEIAGALPQIPEWSELNGAIQRTFQFKDFVEAMRFVDQVAAAAEADQHRSCAPNSRRSTASSRSSASRA